MGNETPTNDAPVTVEEIIKLIDLNDDDTAPSADYRQAVRDCIDTIRVAYPLAALASAPAPSWSETPEHIRDHLALLAEVELHLQSSRVFVTTREKMHPCGVELHDELLGKVTAAIETIGKGQAHG